MRLIQAKVSEEQFKAFSHYCVEHDLTVAGAIAGWIGEKCVVGRVVLGGASESPAKASKPAKEASKAMGEAVDKVAPKRVVVSGLPLEPEFVCKSCGKPTEGEYLCKDCK